MRREPDTTALSLREMAKMGTDDLVCAECLGTGLVPCSCFTSNCRHAGYVQCDCRKPLAETR